MEAIIAAIHRFPTYPVLYRASVAKVRYNGCYISHNSGADIIRVSRYAPTPHLTFAHETGHRIERRGLAQVGATTLPSWNDTALSEWRQAVIRSQAISVSMHGFYQIGNAQEKALIDYLVLPEEMWARCYAQYIAVKSQNPQMLSELKSIQNDMAMGTVLPFQWQDADFVAISDTMDMSFTKKGWML